MLPNWPTFLRRPITKCCETHLHALSALSDKAGTLQEVRNLVRDDVGHLETTQVSKLAQHDRTASRDAPHVVKLLA